jgi:hypothetical protein
MLVEFVDDRSAGDGCGLVVGRAGTCVAQMGQVMMR